MACVTRDDPVLGTVKLCPACPDRDPEGNAWWPLDPEFWYRFGTTWAARCRACWCEDQQARHTARRGGPAAFVRDGRTRIAPGVVAPEYARAKGREWYHGLTAEQRDHRNALRQIRRHAAAIARDSLRTAQASAHAAAEVAG
jgi:hypothetical protein